MRHLGRAERLDYIVGTQDGKQKGRGLDIVVLSECHGKEQDLAKVWNTNRFFVGEAPVEGDPASGVAIVLSARVAKAVRPGEFGCVGSHIVWVVINTATVPLVMIGVYVPHFGRHLSKHPIDARTVFDQLNKLLGSFPSSWIRVVQGDFNARLARNTPRCVRPVVFKRGGERDGRYAQGAVRGQRVDRAIHLLQAEAQEAGSRDSHAFWGNERREAIVDDRLSSDRSPLADVRSQYSGNVGSIAMEVSNSKRGAQGSRAPRHAVSTQIAVHVQSRTAAAGGAAPRCMMVDSSESICEPTHG